MTIFQAILLSITQGITEFLPISSSGHLEIIPIILDWGSHPEAFDIAVHTGTLLAIIIYFRKKIIFLFKELLTKRNSDSLLIKIGLATIPIVILGFLFKYFIGEKLESIYLISFELFFWGVVLLLNKKLFKNRDKKSSEISFKNSFIIGLFQSLALLKGTSRSGMSIIGGLSQGLNLKDASEFAFLLGIPAILGATILQLINYDEIISSGLKPDIYLIGILFSFLSGFIVINLFLRFVQTIKLEYFGIYRIILATTLLIVSL